MRRWVCIIALLAGFSADDYAWSARPRQPVPIERRLDIVPPGPGANPRASTHIRVVGATLTTTTRSRRSRRHVGVVIAILIALSGISIRATPAFPGDGAVSAARPDSVRILIGSPTTLDPAAQGDIGSAAVSAQLFEGVTAFDAELQVRPALAASWDLLDGGRQIVFHLRPNLTYSDGSPISGEDVVRSWMRIVNPEAPSPLVSLIADVEGALAYARGENPDPASVGLKADGLDVEVRLTRPATDFVAIVASPTFAVVPPGVGEDPAALTPAKFVGSGAYILKTAIEAKSTLEANPNYWAGPPPIPTVELVHDIGGRSPVAAFEDGDLDLAGIFPFDATWIAYDKTLGPQLREGSALSLSYYGFDTSKPPFDDVLVRRAFAQAVDWRRLVSLVAGRDRDRGDRHGPARHPRSERARLPPGPRPRRCPSTPRGSRISWRHRLPRDDVHDVRNGL